MWSARWEVREADKWRDIFRLGSLQPQTKSEFCQIGRRGQWYWGRMSGVCHTRLQHNCQWLPSHTRKSSNCWNRLKTERLMRKGGLSNVRKFPKHGFEARRQISSLRRLTGASLVPPLLPQLLSSSQMPPLLDAASSFQIKARDKLPGAQPPQPVSSCLHQSPLAMLG